MTFLAQSQHSGFPDTCSRCQQTSWNSFSARVWWNLFIKLQLSFHNWLWVCVHFPLQLVINCVKSWHFLWGHTQSRIYVTTSTKNLQLAFQYRRINYLHECRQFLWGFQNVQTKTNQSHWKLYYGKWFQNELSQHIQTPIDNYRKKVSSPSECYCRYERQQYQHWFHACPQGEKWHKLKNHVCTHAHQFSLCH